MPSRRTTFAATIVACAALAVAAAPALAAPAWAPAGSAAIKPGNQTHTDGAQCTSNFVFYDGGKVFVGQAAHCSGTGAATETDGCTSQSLPIGTPVEVEGASKPGKLVYNSWKSMQAEGQKDENTCAYNDFALVQLDPADAGKVNPSVPFWGGPSGLAAAPPASLKSVYTYGNSELRAGITQLSPKVGKSLGPDADGWTSSLYTVTPGIPGDSGSGFMDASGNAFGVLSTVAVLPLPASNGMGTLAKELAYAKGHGFPGLTLAAGTEPFNPKIALP